MLPMGPSCMSDPIPPMFLWNIFRHSSIHPANGIWPAVNLPLAIAVRGL